MKTALASDPGDDDEGRQPPQQNPYRLVFLNACATSVDANKDLPARLDTRGWRYNGGAAPTSIWTDTQSGWRQDNDAAPTLIQTMMPVSNESAKEFMAKISKILNEGSPDSTAHVLHFASHGVYDPSGTALASRRSWSAKLGPLTARRLYQRGWGRLPGLSPSWLTSVAVFLAGRKRPKTRAEFRSHMYDWSGNGLTRPEQIRAACGLVLAALVMRLHDASDLAWRPADAVLGSRTLSNLFVWGPVIVTLMAIVHHDGRFGLVADDQDPVALGAFLYIVIKTGRWWRKIKLPEPKPRRAKE